MKTQSSQAVYLFFFVVPCVTAPGMPLTYYVDLQSNARQFHQPLSKMKVKEGTFSIFLFLKLIIFLLVRTKTIDVRK
jgi:hypothetical protein